MKKRTPIFRPIVLTFLMAIPFGIGVGFLGAGIYEGWQEYKREVLGIRNGTNWANHTLEFLSDGTPIFSDRRTSFRQTVEVLTHLDGSSLSEDEEQSRLHSHRVAFDASNHRRRMPFSRAPFEELLSRRDGRWATQDPLNNSMTWRWEFNSDSDDRSLLVARLRHNEMMAEYVSPDGFSLNRPDTGKGFPNAEDSRANGGLLAFRSAGKLIAVDLVRKTVRTITEVDRIKDAWAFFRSSEQADWRFVVRNSTTFKVFSHRGEQLSEFPAHSSDLGVPNLYTPVDGTFILTKRGEKTVEQMPEGSCRNTYLITATWLNQTGQETRTQEFQEVFSRKDSKPSSLVVASVDNFLKKAEAGLALPEPAVLGGGTFFIVPWITSYQTPRVSRNEVVKDLVERMPYAIPVAIIAGLLSTIACWRRQVRYQADWTKTWVVFVFLFGLPALIAWRVHRRWPPLEIAIVSESDFVGPELNGLEIS